MTVIDNNALALETLKAEFPQFKLSHGYLGNCGRGYDDRTWYIFTGTGRNVHCAGSGDIDLATARGGLAKLASRK
jgi:hypothetical protein